MPLKILSTLIREDGKSNATVELTISDELAAIAHRTQHNNPKDPNALDDCGETIFLRVNVLADHPYFPGLQGDAIKRAIAILESTRDSLPKNYK